MTQSQPARSHRRRLFAFLVLTLVFIHVSGLAAQTIPCEAIDQDDMPRNCTFMEKWGQCLYEADDSYQQCRAEADGGFDRMGCDLAYIVDGMACHIASPFTLIRGLN